MTLTDDPKRIRFVSLKEEAEPLRECDDCVTSIAYTAETVSLAGLGDLYRPAPVERAGNGLYHVQNVIEQHGGRLWLESQRGTGTSVFVSLPLQGVAQIRNTLSLTPG